MNLIKFPSPNLTNNSNKASNSLLYQDWEIDEVIEKLSEDEQDLLIERISLLAQSWELTLDSELEAFLQTKYKESKTTFAYTDWLYDLAQEQVYQAYAIEQLDKQRGKVSVADKKGNQSLAASNTQTATTTTTTVATPKDVSANQTINNNSLPDYEEQINQIIANLSEAQQAALMEKTVLLLDEWESTRDAGLELALRTQHQKHQSHISYQDFLYELAQSQVYREYAIEQLELAKQSNAKFVGQFVEIEKVYCDKATKVHVGNVDEPNIDEFIFDNVSQDTSNIGVQLLDANNEITINDELTTNNNSDTFIRENVIVCDVSQVANENVTKEKSLDCHQTVSNSQGHPERITSLKDCASHHITKSLSIQCRKFPITYINEQSSNFALANYSWKNSPSLTKAKKALLMHVHQGKPANIHHPPSLPP